MYKSLTLLITAVALSLPAVGWAQGKIAIVDLQEAILQSDAAQEALEQVRTQPDYSEDKEEFDRIQDELESLVEEFQKDAAVMSQEQQMSARKRLGSKQADLEHVTGKLQQAEQQAGQAILRQMSGAVQEILRDLIQSEGIGLLLQQQAVIHADPGYSITSKVTDRLNQVTSN